MQEHRRVIAQRLPAERLGDVCTSKRRSTGPPARAPVEERHEAHLPIYHLLAGIARLAELDLVFEDVIEEASPTARSSGSAPSATNSKPSNAATMSMSATAWMRLPLCEGVAEVGVDEATRRLLDDLEPLAQDPTLIDHHHNRDCVAHPLPAQDDDRAACAAQ